MDCFACRNLGWEGNQKRLLYQCCFRSGNFFLTSDSSVQLKTVLIDYWSSSAVGSLSLHDAKVRIGQSLNTPLSLMKWSVSRARTIISLFSLIVLSTLLSKNPLSIASTPRLINCFFAISAVYWID